MYKGSKYESETSNLYNENFYTDDTSSIYKSTFMLSQCELLQSWLMAQSYCLSMGRKLFSNGTYWSMCNEPNTTWNNLRYLWHSKEMHVDILKSMRMRFIFNNVIFEVYAVLLYVSLLSSLTYITYILKPFHAETGIFLANYNKTLLVRSSTSTFCLCMTNRIPRGGLNNTWSLNICRG